MSRKMILLGLAALSALALSAVAASGAQAAGRAYTCIETTTENAEYKDPDCTEIGHEPGHNYKHSFIGANLPTQITVHAINQQKFYSEPFLVPVELTTGTLECVECMGENIEEGEETKVVGPGVDEEGEPTTGGHFRYTNVIVANNENCTVTSDPGGEAHVIETEELEFETTGTNSVLISPINAEEILAHFNIVTNPGEHSKKCPLVGTHTVSGTVPGTTNGAILSVNTEELTLDAAFQAELSGETTLTAGPTPTPGNPDPSHHPAALT